MAPPSPKASARAGSPQSARRAVRRRNEIPDEEALPYVFDLLEHEACAWAARTGINVAGAVRMARDLAGPYHK